MLRKFILALAAVALSAGLMSAQDLETATATYNSGAEQLQLGDKNAALAAFQEALKLGEACGADGEELVANCKNAIPGVILSIGKEMFNEKNFEGALAKFQEAAKVAGEYGVADVAAEAAELIPQTEIANDLNIANSARAAKDYVKAAEGYRKVLAADSTNKVAALYLVQSLANADDLEAAKEALPIAEANGQGANAAKLLGNAYLKKANAANKAGKSAEAIQFAEEAVKFVENPQAYLIAGMAAQKIQKNTESIKFFEKYLELSPKAKNAGQIALTIGALYQGQKNNAKAIEFYEKAVAAGQTSAQQYIDALKK